MGIINSIRISIDYDNLMAQARRLEQAADTCGEGSSRLLAQLNEMGTYWQGEAADAMDGKLTELYKGNIRIQKELREEAARIRRIAESIKSVDDGMAAEIRGGSGRS